MIRAATVRAAMQRSRTEDGGRRTEQKRQTVSAAMQRSRTED
jgi:hypothetical protein